MTESFTPVSCKFLRWFISATRARTSTILIRFRVLTSWGRRRWHFPADSHYTFRFPGENGWFDGGRAFRMLRARRRAARCQRKAPAAGIVASTAPAVQVHLARHRRAPLPLIFTGGRAGDGAHRPITVWVRSFFGAGLNTSTSIAPDERRINCDPCRAGSRSSANWWLSASTKGDLSIGG